jgi:hypothetical protein
LSSIAEPPLSTAYTVIGACVFGLLIAAGLICGAVLAIEWARDVAREMKARAPAHRGSHRAPLTAMKQRRRIRHSSWRRAFHDSSVAATESFNARRTDPQL